MADRALANPPRRRIILTRSSPAVHESRLRNELRMFREAGYDVAVYCWDRRAEHPKHEEQDGTWIHRCRAPGSYASKTLFFSMPLWWLCEFFYLLFHRAHGIHACDFDTVVPALLVKWIKRTKVVFDVYDFYAARTRTLPRFLRSVFERAEQFCARRADAVIIVDESRKYLLGRASPRRLVTAVNCPYDGVNSDWKKPERNELVIFYGGLIARFRGIRKLIRLTEDLERVRVIIAGPIKDESYRKLLEDAPHVEYLGHLDPRDVTLHTFNADAVYSYYDPALEINRTANSTKMFEAFMCSTAVLCNAEPPSTQVVSENHCGMRLPYDDDERLRETILQWRDHPEIPREFGRNGRRLFESRYDWRRVSEAILQVYREMGLG
ncbi:MAG: glycosyltransferase [Candidatus Hydrogenedentes bacterium]|nr:glycosyltransferase [Candidatus Hydrogenedentota bacterium]